MAIDPMKALTLPSASDPTPDPIGKLEPDLTTHYQNYMKAPTPETRGALLRAVQPTISKGVSLYAGNNAGAPVKTQAKLIAMSALDTYDPHKSPLQTHLLSNLQGLNRYNRQRQMAFKVPERVQLDAAKLDQGNARLRDDLGREPSDGELADHLSMSLKRIAKVRGLRSGLTTGAMEDMGDGEGGVYEPGIKADYCADQYVDFIYPDLQPHDQAVIDMRFGRNGRKPMGTVGIAKKLNMSPAAVSGRLKNIQAKLDEVADSGVF